MEASDTSTATEIDRNSPNFHNISDADSSTTSNDLGENLCSNDTSKFQTASLENSTSIKNENDVAGLDKVEATSSVAHSPKEDNVEKKVAGTIESVDVKSDQPDAETSEPAKILEKMRDPRIPPKVDCPEKIVFCIDMSSDMNDPPFKLGNGGQFSPLCMVKRVIEIFIHSKLKIDSRHEFAIMGFHETAIWVKDFTNDVKEVSAALDELNEVKVCEESALSPVFTLISVVASDLPSFSRPEIVPPPFIFRVILIYGRSNCIPQNIENIEALNVLKSSPYFFLDVLYIHETPSADNKCQEIFECLCDLDENDTSYIFEVARNTTKLHNCMAKLLAHPLQRPLQKYTYYKLQDVEV